MLTLGRRGVTHEKQPENEEQRARKRKGEEGRVTNGPGKRSRSTSSNSSTSISTISTNISHSPTPSLERTGLSRNWTSTRNAKLGKRRRGSSSSSLSYSSEASSRRLRNVHPGDSSRNTRRRRCSTSPDSRGRERHYNNNVIDGRAGHDRRSSRISRSSSISSASGSSVDQRRRDRSEDGERNIRKRQSSTSSDSQPRSKKFPRKRSHRRTQSRGESRDRSEIIRSRRSMPPGARLHRDEKYMDSTRNRGPPISYDNGWYGNSFKGSDRIGSRPTRLAHSPRPPRNERSLSPFSKRLALTQAMNMER